MRNEGRTVVTNERNRCDPDNTILSGSCAGREENQNIFKIKTFGSILTLTPLGGSRDEIPVRKNLGEMRPKFR